MKKLRISSTVILSIAIVGFVLRRFVVSFPDWLVRINGVLMLVAIFLTVFSTVKNYNEQEINNDNSIFGLEC